MHVFLYCRGVASSHTSTASRWLISLGLAHRRSIARATSSRQSCRMTLIDRCVIEGRLIKLINIVVRGQSCNCLTIPHLLTNTVAGLAR